MIRRALLLPLIVLTLAGCDEDDPAKRQENFKATGNPNASAVHFADVDGCRLWYVRPSPGSSPIYFVRCPEGAARTKWTQSVGKSSIEVTSMGDQ